MYMHLDKVTVVRLEELVEEIKLNTCLWDEGPCLQINIWTSLTHTLLPRIPHSCRDHPHSHKNLYGFNL